MRALLDARQGLGSGGAAGVEASRLEMKQKELEMTMFRLLMDELEYDAQSFRVYRQNRQQFEGAGSRQEIAWQGKLAEEAASAADAYLAQFESWLP